MIGLVSTAEGAYAVDLETGEVEPTDPFPAEAGPRLNLPRVVATAQAGSTIVALVDARPPLLISYDAGRTWRESGRGLPAGRAVAAAPDDPDRLLYATADRIYTSRDGGVFWVAVDVELPDIDHVAFTGA